MFSYVLFAGSVRQSMAAFAAAGSNLFTYVVHRLVVNSWTKNVRCVSFSRRAFARTASHAEAFGAVAPLGCTHASAALGRGSDASASVKSDWMPSTHV